MRAKFTPRCAFLFSSPSSERIRVASRIVLRETPSEAAVGTSCSAVPGRNSPSRMRCRRIAATWSATEIRVISAMAPILLRRSRAGTHILLPSPHPVKCSTIRALDCLPFPLDTLPSPSYHPPTLPFCFEAWRGMCPALTQRQVLRLGSVSPPLVPRHAVEFLFQGANRSGA